MGIRVVERGGDASGMLDLSRWLETYSPKDWQGTLAAIGESEEMLERIRKREP